MGSSLTNADIEDFEKLLNNEKASHGGGDDVLSFADLPQLLDDLLKERGSVEKEEDKENNDEMQPYYESNFWKMDNHEELLDIDEL